jgi:hypothetical protein
MENRLGEHVRALVEMRLLVETIAMTLLAAMIAAGISFVFLLAYVDVELGGLQAVWRRLRSTTSVLLRGHRRRSVAVRRMS